MRIVKWSLALCIILFTVRIQAQDQHLIDSLYASISKAKSDSLKVDLLNQIAYNYILTNPTIAREPVFKALKLARTNHYQVGEYNALLRIGVMHYKLSNFDSSNCYLDTGLFKAINRKDSSFIVKFQHNKAINFTFMGRYKDALDMHYKDLAFYNTKQDTGSICRVLLDIANVYYYLSDYQKAYESAMEAYTIASKKENKITLANSLHSLGVFSKELNRQEEALVYYKKSLALNRELGNKYSLSTDLTNIANIYFDKKEYSKCLAIWDTVITISTEINAKQIQAIAYVNRGNTYSALKQYHKAIGSKLKAYKLFGEIKSLKEQIDCALNLGSTYKDVNDLPNSIKYYREAFYLKDTLFNSEMTANIAQMRTKFDTEKKEQENIRLLKENEIQALKITVEKNRKRSIIIVFGFIVLAFVFLFMRYKLIKKAEIERKLSEEKHLRLIEVIAAEEKERTRVARELHDGLGQILSTARINLAGLEEAIQADDKFLLDNSLKLIDQSVAEVRTISHNLMPVSLMRYGLKAAIEEIARRINDSGKIKVEHKLQNLENRLPESVEHAGYRLVQEIVNNILKHSGASFINLDATLLDGNRMTLRFENDGKTLDTSILSETTGIGWKNIYTRVNMLNGEIAIQPRDESGTIIQIQFTIS